MVSDVMWQLSCSGAGFSPGTGGLRPDSARLQISARQLRLPICDSCSSVSLTVTTGEVAEAHAPNLRQQLELQTRRGRNCATTGARIVRRRCKYRAKRRCCQEGFNTPRT